ncbi:hypothetical protein QQS21_007884 [Conoideocrella luteorostrata]|uniref:Uncharacterized protein n=1 Tax=Conoideocrella luteorostrata TaxID=1105319 RepID=A0AAJ0CM70_9HYPO|nr:hypothetical protein QQS21_007884 [Conoideocrella luteorostrata]
MDLRIKRRWAPTPAYSRSVGQTHQAGDRNFTIAAEAVEQLNLSNFVNQFEKKRFLSICEHWWINVKALQCDEWVLDAYQLVLARQMGIIKRLPNVAEDDLYDRNKGDLFVKIYAVAQLLWFIIQLLLRLIWKFPTTQLEIMTFSFTICTIFTYRLLLGKPKDAQYSIQIPAALYAKSREITQLAINGPSYYVWVL